jgi:hypothetical protein
MESYEGLPSMFRVGFYCNLQDSNNYDTNAVARGRLLGARHPLNLLPLALGLGVTPRPTVTLPPRCSASLLVAFLH